jgi:uncharacterized protein YrrD
MLRSVKTLEGFAIGATDGEIGKVKDFYFDDQAWVVRYLVVETGFWLGREVLISPYSIGTPDWAAQTLPVSITKDQIKHSPAIDSDQPVSRQYERGYLGYYGYPYYWGGAGIWGDEGYPGIMMTQKDESAYRDSLKRSSDEHGDPHLRSCEAVKGYHVHASDGDIGHVQGFILDDHTWSLRYLIVKTGNWWTGHDVLVSPDWIKDISWDHSNVTTHLDRNAIKTSPPYDGSSALNRDAEVVIYNHYDRDGYWQEKRQRAVA